MRYSVVKYGMLIGFILMVGAARGQLMSDSKYPFLLDLKEDTLCLDCSVSNCAALFYNAHLFTKLKHLRLENLNVDLRYIKYFKRLKILEIINPDPNMMDAGEILKAVKRCPNLRSLSITRSSLNYSFLQKRGNGDYFGKLENLKTVSLVDIKTTDSERLAKDIVDHLNRIDTLRLVGCGVHIMNFPEGIKYGLRKTKSRNRKVKYLEIDGNPTVYIYKDKRYTKYNTFTQTKTTSWSQVQKMNRTDYLEFHQSKIKHLVLVNNPYDRTNGMQYSDFIESNAASYLYRTFARQYRIRNITVQSGSNGEYMRGAGYYKSRVHWKDTLGMDSTRVVTEDTARFTRYVGSISQSNDAQTELLPWLLEYRTNNVPVLYDESPVPVRWMNTAYQNGFITPILWNDRRETPHYFSKNKTKKIQRSYQSFVQVECVLRRDRKNYYKLAVNKPKDKNPIKELDYNPYTNSQKLSAVRSLTFTCKAGFNEDKLLKAYILDAWPTFSEADSTYFLVFKTSIRLDSVKVNWWDKNGDTLTGDFVRRWTQVEGNQRQAAKALDRKIERNKKIFDRRKYRLGLFDEERFLRDVNTFQVKRKQQPFTQEAWETLYNQFLQNPWKYFSNSLFMYDAFQEALELQAYTCQHQTEWYDQYADIERVSTTYTVKENEDPKVFSIVLFDVGKKTYTRIPGYAPRAIVQNDGTQQYTLTCLLPTIANRNIRVLVLGQNKSYYCTNPYYTDRVTGDSTFDLEHMPLELIDFGTFMQLIEN